MIVWFWYFRDDPHEHPGDHRGRTGRASEAPRQGAPPAVPWGPLIARMWPVTLTYFCYGWCLWLYLSFLLIFFKDKFTLSTNETAFFASIVYIDRRDRQHDWRHGLRSHPAQDRQCPLRARSAHAVFGFVGALISLLPILYIEDKVLIAICLSAASSSPRW